MLSHVPTTQFFTLHTLNPRDMDLWDHMNLRGFFELPPWGPDYMRAYQAMSSITEANECTITNLEGRRVTITLTRRLVREALNLPSGEGVDFFKLSHDNDNNDVCSTSNKPTWEQLRRQRIFLSLQLHMQHFHMTYPHRWTTPEKTLSTEYSLRDVRGEGVKYDYAQYLLFEIHRGKKSLEVSRQSKAKRKMPLYFGGVLVLTRIVYHAMGVMDDLPPLVDMPEGVVARHYTRKMPMDVPLKRKRSPSRKEKTEPAHRPQTRHATQQEQKKVPTEEELEEELIMEALKLSKIEAGTSS